MKFNILKYNSYLSWLATILSVLWMWLRFPYTKILLEVMFIFWALDWFALYLESRKIPNEKSAEITTIQKIISVGVSIGLLTLLLGIFFKLHHLPGFEYLKILGLVYIAALPLLIIRKIEIPNRHFSLLATYLLFLLAWLSQ